MVIWVKFIHSSPSSSLIPRLSMFTCVVSCLTTSNLPWFMDLTFHVPMQYCSYSIKTCFYFTSPIHNWVLFLFGSIPSLFVELFLHWYPVAYWAPTNLVAQTVKHLPTRQEIWVWSLGGEDPLEKQMATHSSTLAWKIPWTEESGRLQSMGLQRVEHDWATSLHLPGEFIFQCPIFLPFHTVHGILKARILKWFAVPFSSGPHSVRPLHHYPSVLGGPIWHDWVSLS